MAHEAHRPAGPDIYDKVQDYHWASAFPDVKRKGSEGTDLSARRYERRSWYATQDAPEHDSGAQPRQCTEDSTEALLYAQLRDTLGQGTMAIHR